MKRLALLLTCLMTCIPSLAADPLPHAQKPWPLNTDNTRPYLAVTCFLCTNPAFVVEWFYRPSKYSGWGAQWVCGYGSELLPTWADDQIEALKSETTFDKLYAANVKDGTCDDVQNKLVRQIWDQNRPATPVYKVAVNGTAKDRPTYPVVNGVRKTTSNGRIAIGASCSCDTLAIDAAKPYCSVAGQTNLANSSPLPASTVSVCETK